MKYCKYYHRHYYYYYDVVYTGEVKSPPVNMMIINDMYVEPSTNKIKKFFQNNHKFSNKSVFQTMHIKLASLYLGHLKASGARLKRLCPL